MHRFPLDSKRRRDLAKRMIDQAPEGYVVTIQEPTRSLDQNARFWAMLSDVSRACPQGRKHPPETWKNLFLHACGYAARFEMGLNGEPFPVGFRSSALSVRQMSDLMEFISAWGDEHGVSWSDEHQPA